MNAEKKYLIRFLDCDPLGHLNNARYLDYFLNAREDHLREFYGYDMYKTAVKDKKTWVVVSNQIAYLRPAKMQEHVIIRSQIIQFSKKHGVIEMTMWNEEKTELKSLAWISVVFIDLKTGKTTEHDQEIMDLFKTTVNPVDDSVFEQRLQSIKNLK